MKSLDHGFCLLLAKFLFFRKVYVKPVFLNPVWLTDLLLKHTIKGNPASFKTGLALTLCLQQSAGVHHNPVLYHVYIPTWHGGSWVFTLLQITIGKPTAMFYITGMIYYCCNRSCLPSCVGYFDPSGGKPPGQIFLMQAQGLHNIVKIHKPVLKFS